METAEIKKILDAAFFDIDRFGRRYPYKITLVDGSEHIGSLARTDRSVDGTYIEICFKVHDNPNLWLEDPEYLSGNMKCLNPEEIMKLEVWSGYNNEKMHFIQEITRWLNNSIIRPHLNKPKHIYNIAFHHLLRWYPQISEAGLDTYELDFSERVSNWRVSRRAHKAIMAKLPDIKELTKGKITDILKEITHPEHNAPVAVIKDKLLALKDITEKNVEDILNAGYEVILISKEESKILNGGKKTDYTLDGKKEKGKGYSKSGSYSDRLNSIQAEIISKDEREHLIKTLKKYY
ncbi:MAG: hypothetical protein KKA81_15205 [Bacteroidetes bacterium]|nr:hypothetical protein [Bacteroidota bacterium]